MLVRFKYWYFRSKYIDPWPVTRNDRKGKIRERRKIYRKKGLNMRVLPEFYLIFSETK